MSGSHKADLLVEIGTEEIPARMLKGASREFTALLARILEEEGLAPGVAESFATPRRLAALVRSVALRQQDREEDLTGPPAKAAFDADGKPTKAALAFADKAGVPAAELKRVSTPKGEYLSARRRVAGRAAADVLADRLPAAVAGMAFPKTMRWGSGERRFVRPVRWVVALHGAEVMPLEILGVASGGESAAHRILGRGSSKTIPIPRAEQYKALMAEAGVVADRQERREALRQRIDALAREAGAQVVPDSDLLEETADLVEYPGAVAGRYPDAFLALPREVLSTALRHHQKAFSTESAAGQLSPWFISVADTDGDRTGRIREGNEWVVSGRLEDARFFFNEDRRTTLAERRGRLAAVTFHAKAGSYLDKVERVEARALKLAGTAVRRGIAVKGQALAEAARLCKCDLTTGLVGEFPELQGTAGRLYLTAEGGDSDVARAVEEHYSPRGASAPIPSQTEARLLAIADRLDSLETLSGIGGLPTGTKDPFALRRAAFGVVRIVFEAPLPFALTDLAEDGSPIAAFLGERCEHWLRGQGARGDTIRAVLETPGAAGAPLPAVKARVAALEERRDKPECAALVEIFKRCRNIVEQADAGGAPQPQGPVSADGDPESGRALAAALDETAPGIERSLAAEDFAGALDRVVSLRPALTRYFDDVLVMHPDAAIRERRLAPLRRTAALIGSVADLSCIQVSREEMQQKLAALSR